MLLENDAFLTELTKIFMKSKSDGTISITMKRYDGRTKPRPKKQQAGDDSSSEHLCLIRAFRGKKKISTVVHQKDMNKFQLAYANVLKGNIDGLKKKDKKQTITKSKLKANKAV